MSINKCQEETTSHQFVDWISFLNGKKEDEFKAELEEENGLSEHPKKDLLYALVRREIDPGNLIDFMNSYEEFAQLLDKE